MTKKEENRYDKNYRFYSVKAIIKNIEKEKWLLPTWQRDYVWKKSDITSLFDSMLNEFPIGNILLWQTKLIENTFCKFIVEGNFFNNTNITEPSKIINVYDKEEVEAILDGQQRLTTIFLCISKQAKILAKSKDYSPEDELFLLFDVLHSRKAQKKRHNKFWVAKKISEGYFDDYNTLFMSVKELMTDSYLSYFNKFYKDFGMDKKDRKIAIKNINELRKTLFNTKICFRLIDNEPKEAFEIFNRLNSSGAELSPSQLSTCKLIYMNDELKKNIHRDLKDINGKDFEFDISYIVNLLYLITYGKLKDKNAENDTKIVKNYKKAIKFTKHIANILSVDLGLGNKVITSYNAILPMTYYLYTNNKNSKISYDEQKAIKYFLLVSMIKGLFGGSSKDTINKSIDAINDLKNKDISIKAIQKMNIKRNINNNFIVNQDIVKDWLSKYKKGDSTTKLLLYLLYDKYQCRDYDFQEDHLQPDSEFRENKKIYKKQKEKTQIKWTRMKDLIPNLQLLESRKNLKKSAESLKQWLERFPSYRNDNYFPKDTKDKRGKKIEMSLLENFDYFFKEREKLITKKLCLIFDIKYRENRN